MNTFLILSIIGASFFSIILAILLIAFGIPESLSQSYYNLENWKKKSGILFYVYLTVTVLLLIVPMIEAGGFWGFISCVGLAFVGAAPAFKEKTQNYVHVAGALLAAIGAVIELIVIHKILWAIPVVGIILLISLLTKTLKPSLVFWSEMAAFYSLFLGLIIFFI